jgi:oxaloacetate decarboxylase alpha subunit
MLNVLGIERYNMMANETIKYVMVHYGEVAAPVNKDVMDRIMRLPRTKELLNWEPPERSIEELRKKFGIDISEEELVLRALSSDQRSVDEVMTQRPMNIEYMTKEGP